MAKTIEQRLQDAQAAEAKAKQRVRALQSVAAGVERKRDTRRKILLGAWLIEHKPEIIAGIVAKLARESDRDAFAGWKPPTRPTKAPTQEPVQQQPQAAPAARPAAPQTQVTPPLAGVFRRPPGG